MNKLSKLSIFLMAALFCAGVNAENLQSWMSPEVEQAWDLGYKGKRVTVHIVDDFKSSNRYNGDLGNGPQTLRHGEWTRLEASMISPDAKFASIDFTNNKAVRLARGLNTLNLSYGMFAIDGFSNNQINWSSREKSIISYAQKGSAIIVKAAGNDAVAIGSANSEGDVDYLNRALVGTRSAIFVGALNKNGTMQAPASLAYYSNYAGENVAVQNNFLVVGVEGNKTGLYGTSFAVPIVTGYSAILGSKFTKASATQITNQLLNTARTDTISGYNPAIHGRGEASVYRALAPTSIK
jgi:subtilisin family serine protease